MKSTQYDDQGPVFLSDPAIFVLHMSYSTTTVTLKSTNNTVQKTFHIIIYISILII